MAYQDILARAVGSRFGSSAAPWQEYSGTGLPELDIPTGAFNPSEFTPEPVKAQRAYETDWRALLNIIDPEGEGLRTAQARYETLSAQADALGLNAEGEEEGLLTAAAKVIDIPRAAVFSAGKEIADLIGGGGNGASFEDFREQFNARGGVGGLEEGQAAGFGDLSVLKYDEDDSLLERGAKAVGAFAGDVATDPLTYLTFGAGAVGKKAMAGMVRQGVAERAARELSGDVLQEFSQRSLQGRAAAAIGGQTDALPADLKKALDALKIVDDPARVGAEHVAAEAAERYLQQGATGMRQFLEGEFGAAGKKLFDSLPSDVRGGVRMRVPFAYDQGVRRTVNLAGGGGRLAEAMGLDGITKSARQQVNKLRASRAAQTLSSTFGGAHGDLYGKMLADIISKDPDDLTRIGYHQYDSLVKATKQARLAADQMSEMSRRTIGMGHHYIDTADRPEVAREAFERYFQNPEEVRRLSLDQGVEIDEGGMYHVTGQPGAMPDDEVRGLAAAMMFQDTLRHLATAAQNAGVPLHELMEYVPRALTDQAKEARTLRKAGRSPKKGRGGGAYDPTKSRDRFIEPEFSVDPDTGETIINWRHLTPDEANQRVRDAGGEDLADLFESDPFLMMAKYTDGLASIVYRTNFAKLLRDSGEVVKAGTKVKQVYSVDRFRDASRTVEKTAERLDDLGLVDEALKTREVLLEGTAAIGRAATMPEKLAVVDTIAKGLQDAAKKVGKKSLAATTAADRKSLEAARRRLLKAASKTKKAKTRVEEVDDLGAAVSPLGVAARDAAGDVEASDAVEGLGLDKLGSGKAGAALPPELDETFAPETFRLAAEKFYRAGGNESSLQEWIDRVYRPYLSIFKTSATIGRGPGFHVRNLVGGFWNNYLIDVTVADHKLSATIQRARISSAKKARDEAAQEIAKIRSIPITEARRQVSDEAVAQRAEVILRDRLSGVEVAPGLDAWKVHRLSQDQGIAWRQGEQSELSEAQRAAEDLGDVDVGPEARAKAANRIDLFPGDDKSVGQRAANRVANMWWVRKNSNAAQYSESFMRDAAFIQGLRRYGFEDGGEMAALLPKASQFDYHDLSEFERRWLRSFALPFYTWTRKNVPLQFRALMTEPGKMNRLMLAVGAAEGQFGSDDQDLVPEWMRERLGFQTNIEFNGAPLVVGVESPASALNQFFKVDSPMDALQAFGGELVALASPVIQGPLEFATGTDFFTGADLGSLSGSDAPLWYKALGLTKAVPTWDEGGETQGDARIISGVETALPWLDQAQKLAGIGGAGLAKLGVENGLGDDESVGRAPSELVRQVLPAVSVATVTPEQEEGMLYARMDRLSEQLKRHPEHIEQVKMLLELGLTPDQVSSILGIE